MRLVYVRDRAGNLRERLASPSPTPSDDLHTERCFQVLRRNTIGRLGFARHGRPVLLPVTYGVLSNGTIVFRSARGSKLWVAENERVQAAFEVDERDPETGELFAAVAHGKLEPVLDLVHIRRLDRSGLVPWPQPADRSGRWIRLVPDRVEAWQLPGS